MLSSPPPPTPTFFLRIIINFKPIYFCKFINPCFFSPSPRGTHRTGEITPGSRVHCFYAGPGGGGGGEQVHAGARFPQHGAISRKTIHYRLSREIFNSV